MKEAKPTFRQWLRKELSLLPKYFREILSFWKKEFEEYPFYEIVFGLLILPFSILWLTFGPIGILILIGHICLCIILILHARYRSKTKYL